MRRLRFFSLFFLLSLATGCASEGGDESCQRDDECGRGAACHFATSTCMPLTTGDLSIEVLPPDVKGLVRQEFTGSESELHLDVAVSQQGIVSASHDDDAPLPARVRMWRPSLIPGLPPIVYETDTLAAVDKSAEARHYVLWLTPNHTYSLFVSPQPPYDLALPPALEASIAIADKHGKKDIVLDGPDRSVEVQGTVVDAEGKAVSAYPVQIRAYHEDGWLRSTLTRTCTGAGQPACAHCEGSHCPGGFSFRIPFGVRNYTIRAEPTADVQPASGGTPRAELPVMECSDVALGLASAVPDQQAVMKLGEPLRLPSFPLAQEYEISVVGDSSAEPVVGAQVSLELDLPVTNEASRLFKNCRAKFVRTTVTDAQGVARVRLLPGDKENRRYRLVIIPPRKSHYTSMVNTNFEVGPAGGALAAVKLAKRLELSGTVVSHDGRPLSGARIEAQGIGSHNGADSTPPSSSVAVTDDEGDFAIFVDPGTYHLEVIPVAGSGTPRFTFFSKEVTASTSGFELVARAPSLKKGRLWQPLAQGEKGAFGPASDFTVTAYSSAPKSSTELTAIVQATTVTDAEGEFRLLVPRRSH